MASVSDLPAELLTEIFEFVLLGNNTRELFARKHEIIFTLLLVSKEWNRIARQERLWYTGDNRSAIEFTGQPDQEAVRETNYELSAHEVCVRHARLLKAESQAPINVKAVVMGHTGVGKTSLIQTFSTGSYSNSSIPTVFNNASLPVFYNGKEIALSLWDTEMWDGGNSDWPEDDCYYDEFLDNEATCDAEKIGGSEGEAYSSMRLMTFPQTDVFIFCFSLTDRESFEGVSKKWLREVKKWMPPTPHIFVLCGTKADLQDKRVVSQEEAHALASAKHFYAYIECSSAQQVNVENVIRTCLDGIFLNLSNLGDSADDDIPYSFSAQAKSDWLNSTYVEWEDTYDIRQSIKDRQRAARVKCDSVRCYPIQQQ